MKTISRLRPTLLTEEIRLPEYGIEVFYSTGMLQAIFYSGKSLKKDWYYRFRTIEEMMKKINDRIDFIKKCTSEKLQKRAEQKAKQETLKASDHFQIGDIILNSWGYDQTNVDFYQVIEVLNKKIRVQSICGDYKQSGFDCGYTTPIKDKFSNKNEVLLLSLKYSGDKVYICNPESYAYFHKWSGKPEYESHYA
jgi:hypothetical protein